MHVYSVHGYGEIIADRRRTDAYRSALRQTVEPGSIVVDIGTGTGILALLACQCGARTVYAIEASDAIQVARDIAQANGYADRIQFIQGSSSEINLSERADVIVSDLRGVLPLFQNHLPVITDARQRFLASDGVMIPQRDTLWVSVVEAPDLYGSIVDPWDANHYGLDMRPARELAINRWRKARINPGQLLVEPACWGVVDYATIEQPSVGGTTDWRAARSGTAHGLVLWFESMLTERVRFSNAPGEPELIYGHAFFPMTVPVPIAVGDSVSVVLQARLINGDYVWRWKTRIVEEGRGRVKADLDQSTFLGVPVSTERLKKLESKGHVDAGSDP